MVIYPFHQGDSAGSWESKSNLRKGLALKEILEKKGYRTSISRGLPFFDLFDDPVQALFLVAGGDAREAFGHVLQEDTDHLRLVAQDQGNILAHVHQ